MKTNRKCVWVDMITGKLSAITKCHVTTLYMYMCFCQPPNPQTFSQDNTEQMDGEPCSEKAMKDVEKL